MVEPVDINDIKAQRERLQSIIKKDKEKLEGTPIGDIYSESSPIPSAYKSRAANELEVFDLKYMNTNYAFVHSIGGKPAIMTEIYNEYYKRKIKEFISVESLHTKYLNKPAKETEGGKSAPISIAKWWLAHQYRKDYATITFEPDKAPGEYYVIENEGKGEEEKTVTYYNMWEGFGVTPTKGCWKRTSKHIYTILCNSDRVKFRYVIKWFAWAIQNPGDRAGVAIIFKGKKGSGKGTILQMFVDIFGRHGLVIASREHLTGKHNAHLENLSFLYADEAYHPGDKEVEGILKNLITEPSLTLEPKFKGLKTSRNCLHIAMATNADWVIPATEDERRYFINETDNRFAKGNSEEKDIREHFNALYEEINTTGKGAMLFDLLHMNLKGWHPRNEIPETEEMRNQIALSLPKLKGAVFTLLEEGIFPGEFNSKGEYQVSNKNFLEYLQSIDPQGAKNFTMKSIANLTKTLGIKTYRDSQARYLIFPELGILRAMWNRAVTRNEWPTNIKWTIGKAEY